MRGFLANQHRALSPVGLTDIEIACLDETLKSQWRQLFRDYTIFYGEQLDDAAIERVWSWLMDRSNALQGVLAMRRGEAIGLAHFHEFMMPVTARSWCAFDDLYVDPRHRGGKAWRVLFDHVINVAIARGNERIRWETDENNYRARALYDVIGERTFWTVYEINVDAISGALAAEEIAAA